MYPILRTLAGCVRCVVAECNHAQRRLVVLQASPDRYLLEPDQAPGTYELFLFRTSGKLVHEPSAAERLAGEAVR
jgi:hypothetical protein